MLLRVRMVPHRFRGPDGGLRTERMLHPAKAVAPMQACAVHLRDRIDSLRSPFQGSLRLSIFAALRFQKRWRAAGP